MMQTSARYHQIQIGAEIQVDNRETVGHCRAPLFVRGKPGVVVAHQGVFRDPERLAYHQPGLPALPLYKVRFKQRDLWPDYNGAETDQLELDLYENWLVPVGANN